MIQNIHRESEKLSLKINANKSIIITKGLHISIAIHKDLPPIQCKEKTIYLGQVMSFKNKMVLERNRRKSLSWNNFRILKLVYLKTMKSLDKIKLRYIKDVFSLCLHMEPRSGPTQRAMLRSILLIKRIDHIKTESMYKGTKIEDLRVIIKRSKWRRQDI